VASGGTVVIKLTVEQKQALAAINEVKGKLGGILSGVTGLKGQLAAAFGIGSLTAFAFKSIFASSAVRELDTALVTLAKNTGISEPYIRSLEKAMTDLGLTSEGAKRSLVPLIANEADLSQTVDLTRVAMDAAAIAQEDVESTLEAISIALASGQTKLLKRYQLYVDVTEANKIYAASIGKTTDQLTAHDQQQALTNALLEKGKTIAGTYAANQGEIGLRWREMHDTVKKLLVAAGDLAQRGFGAILGVVERVLDRTIKWLQVNKDVIESKITDWCEKFARALEDVSTWLGKHIRDIILWAEIIASTMIIAKIVGIGAAIYKLVTAIKVLGVATALGVGPIGILIAAISGLAAGILYLRHRHAEQDAALDSSSVRYVALAQKIDKTTEEMAEFAKLHDEIESSLPGYTQKLDEQAKAYQGQADAVAALATNERRLANIRRVEELNKEITANEALVAAETKRIKAQGARLATGTEGMRQEMVAGQPWINADIAQANNRLTELKGERAKIEKELVDQEQEAWNKVGAAMGPPTSLMPIIPDAGDIAKVSADAEKAWQTILDNLHQLRLEAIADDYEKEKALLGEKYAKLYADISAAKGVTPEEQGEASTAAHENYVAELAKIDAKHNADAKKAAEDAAEETRKAAEEASKAKVDLILAEVDYKKRLYAWDTEQYIAELERQLTAAGLTAEDKKLLEEQIYEAKRDLAVEGADAERDTAQQTRDSILRVYNDIKGSFVDAATTAILCAKDSKAAWQSFGQWIKSYLVKMVLESLIDKLWEAIAVAKILAAWKFISAIFSGGATLAAPGPVYAQHGIYARRPTNVIMGEAGDEIASPVPVMRRIVREEIAAAGGGGTTVFHISIPVQTLDAQSFETSARSGMVNDVLTRAVRDAWLQLQVGR
jgi:hypothetical protein